MLQVKNISKTYITGELRQEALDDVSLTLRDNEFVAILGPSGSGKTTLLNVIGGLDRYDSGDLIINGISTKKYSDRDWDSYRNHTIGFVFQSYNLIPHQTILSNVELALTISGVSKSERKKRAIEALEKVGLGDQLHKKPNQMSGGQMQRVAIARALINDPDILLADEPTGALDSETSLQVMELLKEVASDRLVVMVTHNPELAENYANRIVRLKDGKITSDSNPYNMSNDNAQHKNMGHASMSLLTALSLSFNNLRTKKGRTILTAFAGSIGIIGIALILSLSNGVNNYITDIQKETMSSYPITIEEQTFDMSSLISVRNDSVKGVTGDVTHELDAIYPDAYEYNMKSSLATSVATNNLTAFKKYLDDENSEIHKYIGENGIAFTYDTAFGVYSYDPDGKLVSADGVKIREKRNLSSSMMPGMSNMSTMLESFSRKTSVFYEMLSGPDKLTSQAVKDCNEVLAGRWPESYDEVVLCVNRKNEVALTYLFELGLLPSADYDKFQQDAANGVQINTDGIKFDYNDVCGKELYLLPACEFYVKDKSGSYRYIGGDPDAINENLDNAFKLKIVGVIRSEEDAAISFTQPIGYTAALTERIIDYTNQNELVKAQLADPDVNILNGLMFSPATDEEKINDVKTYLSGLTISEKASMIASLMTMATPDQAAQFAALSEAEAAAYFEQYMATADPSVLVGIYDEYISNGSYEENIEAFGVVSYDAPTAINIYADTFEDKDGIADAIKAYNNAAAEEDRITYTDYVALLMSSITTIIDVISYVLIAFVSVSLIVSSIMIGIITYISVLERTKEIGILRALGASKRNVSRVFNAETFIIGLIAGILGVTVSALTLIPANAIIHNLAGTDNINAVLPIKDALVLIVLSMILTLIGGLIPSRKAAKKDPVTALRTE